MSEKRDEWEAEERGSQGGAAMAAGAKAQLFQGLKAQTSELEN
jgi:hypothetical protein